MKKNIISVLKNACLGASIVFMSACGDCCEECDVAIEVEDPVVVVDSNNCNAFNTTIERFKVKSSVADSNECLTMFEFPIDQNSGGSNPKDTLSELKHQILLSSVPFTYDGKNYLMAIFDVLPSNSRLVGDILVSSTDVTANTATIRVAGRIAGLPDAVVSEEGSAICKYMKKNKSVIEGTFRDLMSNSDYQYGRILSNAQPFNYAAVGVDIINSNGSIIGQLGDPGMPTPTPDKISEIADIVSSMKAYDITISPGQAYAYISKYGVSFVFIVTEIRKSPIFPYRERVTIMFHSMQ